MSYPSGTLVKWCDGTAPHGFYVSVVVKQYKNGDYLMRCPFDYRMKRRVLLTEIIGKYEGVEE